MKRYDFRCMLTGDSKVIIEPQEYGGWCDYKEAELEIKNLQHDFDTACKDIGSKESEIAALRARIAGLESPKWTPKKGQVCVVGAYPRFCTTKFDHMEGDVFIDSDGADWCHYRPLTAEEKGEA
ncbi:MAG: hypothetical protein ABFC56_07435 [Clostridiaceae bacterium]